ncbi:MAG: HAD family phosphatase [Clostridiales bacterium]|nr:HAD family phosphatase [Clostridiales bacterium]
MINNIVLDMGNVLLTYDPEIPLSRFLDGEEDRAVIRRELFEGPEWVLRDQGAISEEEMLARVAARVPERLYEGLRRCNYEWMICMKPIPEARIFCDEMKEKGYGIYVLSNAADNFYTYFTDFAPREYFDGILYSAEVGVVKPDARIYRCLLDRFRLRAEECLFLDDRNDNVEGARAVGMQAEVYKGNFEEIKVKYDLDRKCGS